MTTRRETWQYRKNNIGYLAQAIDNVQTLDEVNPATLDHARDLYMRLVRVALANGNLDESETEFNCNNPARKHKKELILNRLHAIKNEVETLTAGRVTTSPISMFYVTFCEIDPNTHAIKHEIARPQFFEY